MKYLSLLFFALSISLYAYKTAPLNYYGIEYGLTTEEVNAKLQSNNFIATAIEPEEGYFYKHPYADPELSYYDKLTSSWMNISFTKIKPIEFYKRDASITFPGVIVPKEFQRMTIKASDMPKENNDVTVTPWVYRFYFHKNKLVAVSLRLEDESTLEKFRANNTNNANAHPGYQIDNYVFSVNKNKVLELYGGFDYFLSKSINKRSAMYYGAYIENAKQVELSVFYEKRDNSYANLTVSYFDTYLFNYIARSFQNVKFVESQYNDEYLPKTY